MKVFISWSGERSKALASCLHEWLPLVLQYVEPFVSDKDISAGDRWARTIADELETSNFGIICITPENVDKEWILFEAGALSKSMLDGKVIPLLFDLELSDLGGPLAQFQALKVDEAGIMEVVRAINKVADNKAAEEIVSKLTPKLWPDLEESLAKIPTAKTSDKHTRSQPEILEELVTGVRGLTSRMRDFDTELSRSRGPLRRRPRTRLHPHMMDEIMHVTGEISDKPVFILLLAGVFRDDIPWLAELLAELYREIKDGDRNEIDRSINSFHRTLKQMMHHPMIREMNNVSKDAMMMVENLPNTLDMALIDFIELNHPRKSQTTTSNDANE